MAERKLSDDLANAPGNSSSSKAAKLESEAERKPLEPITSGRSKKKGFFKRVLSEDNGSDVQSVGEYVVVDVILPAVKRMVSDAVSQGVDRLLFGDSAPRRRNGYTPYGDRRTYSSPGSSRISTVRSDNRREMSYRAKATHDFNEIVYDSREEGEMVLDRISDLIDNYNVATVADLYDLSSITGSFVDRKWGWTDIRGARLHQTRDGYVLSMPQPEPLK